MIDVTRELIAYAIIGVTAVTVAILTGTALRKRHYRNLRRRGIKRHGH